VFVVYLCKYLHQIASIVWPQTNAAVAQQQVHRATNAQHAVPEPVQVWCLLLFQIQDKNNLQVLCGPK
jgi:hypothetical protein